MGLYAYWKVTRRFNIMIIQGVKTSMEKNRLRPTRIPGSKNIRMSYARQKDVLDMPNLIEVQKDSYKWFLTDGLKEVFEDISPIKDYADNLALAYHGLQWTAHPGVCGLSALQRG